ncbi:trypsin-like peptidase domain-containing protein [Candidatus Parcubacteria bacterium]|nr:trypsin-like peptidase domain-containing protein [Candidatus Parcubacteria bacterium]
MINPKSFLEQILFSTLRIELLDNANNPQSIGTGFLVRVNFLDDPTKNLILLISNKHVLEKNNKVNLIFHKKKQNSDLPSLKDFFIFRADGYEGALSIHPDPKIDLACINISNVISQLGPQVYFKFLEKTIFANFNEAELDVGQKVIFAGYPNDRYDQKHNLPIMRSGIIASHPKLDYNGEKQFIIDAQVFPGSSGSPVFLNMKEAQYNRGQIILGEGFPYLLIGIVAATMIRNNIIEPLPTNLLGVSQEIIGLGLVFKATTLDDLINEAIKKAQDNEANES